MTVLQGAGGATSRRAFVAAAGASGLAVALAACGGSDGSSSSRSARSSGDGGGTLGPTSEIPEGGGKIFTDEKVVVTQPRKGEFKAFTSTCTHAGCQVGSVGGGTINCPCHGSKFSIEDGSVKAPPASSALEERKIEVKGGSIRLA
ncbi:Rieske (2Fe-2S) protein [Streptomyces sp. NPDC007088]|uniref:Rieske (2Fe-2S) protein n=1 Tax=Streptomyces sp. NPDC007088 TaxID=3364773 RepID=UPI003684AD34